MTCNENSIKAELRLELVVRVMKKSMQILEPSLFRSPRDTHYLIKRSHMISSLAACSIFLSFLILARSLLRLVPVRVSFSLDRI